MKHRIRWLVGAMVCTMGALALTADAKTITIKNNSGAVRTLSDLYTFSGTNNTGTKKEILKKGDASDDVNIAAGGTKNYDVGDAKSFTISWMEGGKEVETDTNSDTFTFTEKGFITVALLGYPGLHAIAFADVIGPLPPVGYTGPIVNGKFLDPAYEWITFYDTTESDGLILRDHEGNPISPLVGEAEGVVTGSYTLMITD